MSSKQTSKYRDDTRGRPIERHRDSRARSKDKKSERRSISPRRKHTSSSKEMSPERKHKHSSREIKKQPKNKKSKKKKKANSSSSSSSSSSDSDEEELKLLQRLEAERLRLKEERKRQKEMTKANETPEEKRGRRLKEKQEKERKRRERMGWDNEYQCYTDQDNPFGDSALTDTFVWTKKLAKEGVKNVSHNELEALNRQKQLENKIELEKVKQRRLEREAERAAREAEAAAAARAREAAQFSSWARHEDEFHLQQARLRSQIRIRDGRAKPIDLLAWYVSSEQCVDALEMHEPYTYLNGLHAQDLEDLLEDIKVYKELEADANQSYWEDVQTIVAAELVKLRRLRGAGGCAESVAASGARDGVHAAVAEDVAAVFKGKSSAALLQLQAAIEDKLAARTAGLDLHYWESLLTQLKAHMARARLRDRHQNNLRRKLQLLKKEQGVAAETGAGDDGRLDEGAGDDGQRIQEASSHRAASPAPSSSPERASSPGPEAWSGDYSPRCVSPAELEPGTLLLEPEEERQRLGFLRARLHAAAAAGQHAAALAKVPEATAPSSLEASARRSMAGGEGGEGAQFSVEHVLPDQPCLWADKYRPRKPRYFNRVHTGFEWNKYNQTHYDMDNPPPKIVQGYKFNIFYPDLIDKSATPEFSLKPCSDNPEFAVLRFHAGPPYEDIAFKIVNREWEYSYKRGFRCHFHNNIFQLWFHFKRYRYRR